MTHQSQCNRILAYLRKGKGLTSWQAIQMWGCTRLAARRGELQERGHKIPSEMRKLPDGRRVAVYRLVRP